jgi:hypothetical protein
VGRADISNFERRLNAISIPVGAVAHIKSSVSSADRRWSIVVKETTMGWISRFLGSGEVGPAEPWSETIINGAPYDARKAIRSIAHNPSAPGYGPDPHIAEEIKRRQVSLAVRYVMAVRAH